MKRLTIQIGFITNSSSVIHWFPKEVLTDPEVRTFIEAYGIGEGFVGEYLWSRSSCGSFLVTDAQKNAAEYQLNESEYGGGGYSMGGPDKVTVIYGDEYTSVASELCEVLSRACRRMEISEGGSQDYN